MRPTLLYSIILEPCRLSTDPKIHDLALVLLLFFLQRDISAVSRPIAAKLCHMIGNGCIFKNYTSKNSGSSPPQKKKWGAKKLFAAISDDFALRSWISPERNMISTIGKRRCKLYDLSRVCWHNLVNIGPQTAKIGPYSLDPLNIDFFGERFLSR